MIARHATPADAEALFALLEQMHGEIALAPLDADKMRATVEDMIADNGVCVICEGAEIVGSIGLHVYALWYSRSRVVQDMWLYIHPEHRSLEAFKLLLGSASNLARMMGLPLFICLQATRDHDRKDVLFRRYMDQVMKAYRFDPCGGYYAA